MIDKTKFVVLTTQRSGSTYLRLLLNSYRSIRCHGEIFLRNYFAEDGFREYMSNSLFTYILYFIHNNPLLKSKNQPDYYNNYLKDFLNKLYKDQCHSNAWHDMEKWNEYISNDYFELEEAVGFKLMYDQIQINDYLKEFLQKNDVKIIHLSRKNKLKQFLSYRRMKENSQAHTTKERATNDVYIDISKFEKYLKKTEYLEKQFSSKFEGNCSILNISYEDINNSLEVIFDFLGIVDRDIQINDVKIKKISKGGLSDQISNYKEVEAYCRKNDYDFIE